MQVIYATCWESSVNNIHIGKSCQLKYFFAMPCFALPRDWPFFLLTHLDFCSRVTMMFSMLPSTSHWDQNPTQVMLACSLFHSFLKVPFTDISNNNLLSPTTILGVPSLHPAKPHDLPVLPCGLLYRVELPYLRRRCAPGCCATHPFPPLLASLTSPESFLQCGLLRLSPSCSATPADK